IRTLGHVEVGAVVVRLVEQRRSGCVAKVRDHQPLTEPAGSPLTIPRWGNMNSAATGSAAISVPAANGPPVLSYWLLTSEFMPTGSVRCFEVCRMVEAITNSLSVKTKEISATTASTGAASGRTTPQKICAGVAPSTLADSSSSVGIVSKKPFINQ